MSVSKWAYEPKKCDGGYCPGDCDECVKANDDEEYLPRPRWIYQSGGYFTCPDCGGMMVRNVFPFCPWCGADMRGETE